MDGEAWRGLLGTLNKSGFTCFGTALFCQFIILRKVLINIVKYIRFRQVHIPDFGSFLDSWTELIKTQASSAGICRLISHSDISLNWPTSNLKMSFFFSLRETMCKEKPLEQNVCMQPLLLFNLPPIRWRKKNVLYTLQLSRSHNTMWWVEILAALVG